MKKTKSTTIKNTPQSSADIAQNVMAAINQGEVSMKPKIYFIIASIILGGSVALAVGITSLMVMAIIYHLRTANPIGFLQFGAMGGRLFLQFMPWVLLGVSAIGVMLSLKLLKQYDFSYKNNFIIVSLACIVAIITSAVVFDKVGINERLEQKRFINTLYKQATLKDNVIFGEIINAANGEYTIKEKNTNDPIKVSTSTHTRLNSADGIEVGDEVRIVGVKDSNNFKAVGIKEIGKHSQPNQTRPRIMRKFRQ